MKFINIFFKYKKTEAHYALLFCGAGDEARTRYLHLGKVALYQMSYARRIFSLILAAIIEGEIKACRSTMPQWSAGLYSLEATPGFEPGNQGFADPCLTTWLCRRTNKRGAQAPVLFGAGDEARTRYLHLGKVALYQMSYARVSRNIIL